jgi:hypothetical protein
MPWLLVILKNDWSLERGSREKRCLKLNCFQFLLHAAGRSRYTDVFTHSIAKTGDQKTDESAEKQSSYKEHISPLIEIVEPRHQKNTRHNNLDLL